ncbi:tyrosine-type recombinase/integrase [Priestia koreensis]|uniref:tyrosine-type recombinase/integrase n=1 Tax=Priestia koreensis TaxID=284581 RepID=UPI001F59D308|nr:tyrosine-type recombinase/integrase [Priestia koreensis]
MQDKYWESSCDAISLSSRQVLNEYLLSLKLENKAVATIIKYRWFLEKFLKDCPPSLEDISSEFIRKWLDVFSIDKKPRTIDLVLATLSSFFTFCLNEEYIENAVMKKRWRPQIPKSLPKYLDDVEYVRVKRVSEYLPLRDRAIILFLLSSGCRVSELSNLNIEDIHFESRTAEVTGKGKKIRHIHFSQKCAFVLNDYLRTRLSKVTDPLFMNKFGNPLLTGGIRKVVRKAGIEAEFNQSFHPHCCRHTFATRMLARGADLQFIADEMGHSDLNTTRGYARIPTEDMILKYHNIMG